MSMSSKMQKAAVLAAMAEGQKLDRIRKDYPDLAEGIKLVDEEAASPPSRRGSGAPAPMSTRRPKGL